MPAFTRREGITSSYVGVDAEHGMTADNSVTIAKCISSNRRRYIGGFNLPAAGYLTHGRLRIDLFGSFQAFSNCFKAGLTHLAKEAGAVSLMACRTDLHGLDEQAILIAVNAYLYKVLGVARRF